MGKGSKSRIGDKKRFDENYENIYGENHARNSSQEDKQKSKGHVVGGSVHDQEECTTN
jgi:hypothetical protein